MTEAGIASPQPSTLPAEATIAAVTNKPTEMPEVVVRGRAEDILGVAVGASAGAIGEEDLKDLPLLRRGEIMETVPGLVVTQHSGDGKANQYFLRGFNLDHGTDFAFSVDDVPVNLPSHAHGQGYSDLNFMIPELVNFIEYSKGPFYSQIGDFSGSGADIDSGSSAISPFRFVIRNRTGFRVLGRAFCPPICRSISCST